MVERAGIDDDAPRTMAPFLEMQTVPPGFPPSATVLSRPASLSLVLLLTPLLVMDCDLLDTTTSELTAEEWGTTVWVVLSEQVTWLPFSSFLGKTREIWNTVNKCSVERSYALFVTNRTKNYGKEQSRLKSYESLCISISARDVTALQNCNFQTPVIHETQNTPAYIVTAWVQGRVNGCFRRISIK